jgi:hypothetical protein
MFAPPPLKAPVTGLFVCFAVWGGPLRTQHRVHLHLILSLLEDPQLFVYAFVRRPNTPSQLEI